MKLSKAYLPMGIASVLLPVTAVGAIAGGDESSPPSAGHAQVQAIEPDASQALSVLEQSRTVADDLPAGLAARMDRHAPFGMNPALSRIAIGNATNSVYVIPANGHVCATLTIGEGANLSCRPTEDIAAGDVGPATVGLEGQDVAIYGLVPDGVDSVSIGTATSSIEVETERNAYYTVVPAGTQLRTASYDGPSGVVEFTIHDPAAVFGGE